MRNRRLVIPANVGHIWVTLRLETTTVVYDGPFEMVWGYP